MRPLCVIGALIGSIFLIYGKSIFGQFVYDDLPIVVQNPLIRRLDQIPSLFGTSYWGMYIGQSRAHKGSLYRPLTMTTFALNYSAGKLDPRGYHLVNLFLHLGVTLLLWGLCLRLGFSPWAAGAAGLLYAVLPIHTEAVTNVVGRSEVLAAFFVLLSWICVTKKPPIAFVCLGTLSFALALLSKENSAAFLPVLMISDVLSSRKPWKELAQDRFLVWICFGGVLLLYLEWRYLVLGQVLSTGGAPYFTTQSRIEIILTMAKFTIQRYLRPLMLGIGFCAEYSRPAFADARLSDVTAWVCLFLLTGLIGSMLHSTIKRRDWATLGILIFFLFMLPVSNLLIPIQVIGAERFLYLPSVGYCMGLGLLAERFFLRSRRWGVASRWAFLGVFCLWYGLATFGRNRAWRSQESFYKTTVQDAPRSPRAWNGLGVVFMNQQQFPQALTYFDKALALDASLSDARYNKAECYYLMGNFKEAKKRFLLVSNKNGQDRDTLMYLAALSEKEADFASAALYYARVITVNPLDRSAKKNLALLHCRMGHLRLCRDELHAYLEEAPSDEHNNDLQQFLKQRSEAKRD